MPSRSWTRREFLRGAAGVVALQSGLKPPPQFAYVASGAGSLHVFRAHGALWTPMQQVPSAAPACVLLSADQQILYVANDVEEHQGQPRGTVEAFRIDPLDGRLTFLARTALSLSATRPRHMALSPDGKLLAVAAYGGGVYNLLPLAKDGGIGQPTGIFKDAGCGPRTAEQASAHPHTLLFDADGHHLLSSDFGSDRLTVFAVEDGKLSRRIQRSAGEGSGPGTCVLHPKGFFYVCHGLEGTLATYRYEPGRLGEPIQKLQIPGGNQGLAVHPSGHTLYTTQPDLTAWRIENGTLTGRKKSSPLEATSITLAPDGDTIFALDAVSGSISRLAVDPSTGEPSNQAIMAHVIRPRSLAFKTT